MATRVNGIAYHLADDCDTLLCKLDNAAFEAFMDGEYDTNAQLEEDRDRLEAAINNSDREVMQEMLDKYHTMFRRYSHG